jgi:DNA-3-methyladenine glycosylase
MPKILSPAFFDRPTVAVAKKLLGKCLARKYRRKIISLTIAEVEVYDGPHDLASHASHGRTPRTKIMFGDAGYFYVYFTYGMHWLVNVVTGPREYPAAILIRAGIYHDPETGREILIDGPARLTKFLKITGAQNGKVAGEKTGLWFENRGVKIKNKDIVAGKRVGVDYAGPTWSSKKWNFRLRPKILTQIVPER